MGRVIAVAGKGGTGKTTITGLVIRAIKEHSQDSILAVDADPNSNLGQALGAESISTIVGIIDDIKKNPDQISAGMTKDRFIDLKIQESLDEKDGYDLMSMGRPEGPGCYCFANNMLRELISKLMNSYEYTVIDNEAGMEHLSRRLVRHIDTLFIVSDNSAVGIRSAARISRLADELNITVKERFLLLNKSRGRSQIIQEEVNKTGLLLKTEMPFSDEIEDAAIANKSVFELNGDNPVLSIVKGLLMGEGIKKG